MKNDAKRHPSEGIERNVMLTHCAATTALVDVGES
jgi:hypothetical protein